MLIDVLLFGSEWVGAQLSPTLDLDLKSIHQKIVLIEVLHRSYILCMLRRYDTILLHYNSYTNKYTTTNLLRLQYYNIQYTIFLMI